LDEVDAQELGEVVDMIKDLEEAEYYCAVVKAMEESEKYEHKGMMYYEEYPYREDTYWTHMPKYYGPYMSSKAGHQNGEGGNGMSYYTEQEMPYAFDDPREGKSYRSRRMYMEGKEMHKDKSAQLKELEKYAQELSQDVVEMIEDASPEERQYLGKKISALATKITQVNDQH
jgi:hypothetical protein